MRIEDYGPQVHISRRELDNVCYNVVNHFGLNKLYNAALNKCIVPYGCFDSTGKYFGNLGLEVDINGECSNHAHFNLRGVNPEHFGIYRDWQPGEFAPYMKHHPAIYERVAVIKDKCKFANIHIYENIDIQWDLVPSRD